MTLEMSKAHFDNTLETVLAVSVCGIVFAAMWIIILLIQIESSKVSFFSVDDDPNSLDLHVVEDSNKDKNGMEVEQPPSNNGAPAIKQRRGRRVPCGFKMMQVGSVAILILLTYLLLVTSNAPIWLSALGSISVFGMFLRFQIGDEIRRQRWDRLTLMMSLFLLIAAFLNLSTYAWQSLAQGEIYLGPARIVGYDATPYNNTNQHDPTTRTDLMVQWGKDWGCPYTGGKVCQAHVQGVMCAVRTDGNRLLTTSKTANNSTTGNSTSSANHTGWTKGGSGDTNSVDTENEDLEKENNQLQQKNELLEEEVEELKEQNDEQQDEAMDTESLIEDEMIGDEFEDAKVMIDMEEDEDEANADVDEMEDEMDKESIEDKIQDVTDDAVLAEMEKNVELADEEIDETQSDLDELEDEYDSIEDEYSDIADEYYDEADVELDAEIEEIGEEGVTDEELYETEQALDEDQSVTDDDWYWQELDLDYEDDMYNSEYWDYDWDSAWGEYGCSDLFDNDMSGATYDANVPAGGDDDWPFINIYGSCKTCDAYIMDYFAEEAFVKLDDYFLQAVMYLVFTVVGMGAALIGFIKYKIAAPAENQIELLGSDGGVIA